MKLGGTGGDQIYDLSLVTVNTGTLDLNGQSEAFDTLAGTGGTILNNGGGASTLTISLGGGTYSGVIANNTSGGGTMSLIKSGSGTQTLSGPNTYTGLTDVQGGTLALGASNVFANASTLKVSGGILSLAANSDTVAGVQLTGGSITGSTGILTSNTAFDLQAGSVSAILAGTTGANKTTAGTVTLSRVNTYTGVTDVQVGTLALGASNVFADTSTLKISGGTLSLAANSDTVAGVQLTGGSITGTTGVLTSTGPFAMQSGSVSAILGGAVALNKTTAGTVILSGVNTYNGLTTVSAGTLEYGANNAIAGGAVTVSGGILDIATFNDTVGTVTLTSGSIAGTSGVLSTTGTFEMQSGSVSAILGGAVALNKTTAGTVTLSGANTNSGLTTVSAGELDLNTTGGQSIAGNLTVSGGTAKLLQASQINSARNLVVSSGTFDLQTFNQTVANVQMTGGSIIGSGGTLTSTTAYDLRAGSVSAILGGSVALNKTTAGTVTLTGANTYSGATNITAGVLSVDSLANGGVASGIGQSTNVAANLVLGAATLQYTGATAGSDRNFTLTAATTSSIEVTNAPTDLTISGASTATTGALTKIGAGRLILTGNNLHTGITTVSAGTLRATTSTGALGAGNLTLAGGTLELANDTGLAFNRNTTVSSNSTIDSDVLTLAGAGVTHTLGTLGIGAQTLSIAKGANVGSGTAGITFGAVTLSGNPIFSVGSDAQLTMAGITSGGADRTITFGGDGNTLVSGVVDDASGGGGGNTTIVTKTGTGTLTLAVANTYQDVTTISEGVIKVQNNTSLGTTAAGTTVASGAAIQIDGSGLNVAEAITSLVHGGGGPGALRNLANNNTWSGAITLGGASRINSDAGTLTLSGGVNGAGFGLTLGGAGNITVTTVKITDSAGTTNLIKDGAGNVTLNVVNDYSGSTTVYDGTLKDGVANALPTGTTLTVAGSGATFDLGGLAQQVAGLSDGGVSSGTVTNSGAAAVFTVNNAAANAFSGTIGGTLALTKTAAGTLTLSGTNTYTGITTISGGVLSVATIGDGGVAGNLGAAAVAAANLVIGNGTLQYTGSTASTNRAFTITTGQTATFDITTNDLTVSGASATTTGALTKTGAGTLILSGTNAYTGLTTVSGGTLEYGVTDALSNGAVTVNGGILDIKTFSDTVGAVTLTSGSIDGTTGVLTGTSYALNGTVNTSVSAILGGAVALTKSNAGTATLSGTNTYTGITTISGGILSVATIGDGGVAGNLGAAAVAAANLVIGNGTLQYTGSTASTNRAFTITNGQTATFDITTNDLTVSGASANTTGALTKTGAGTLILSGANAYTGLTTVGGGTLEYGVTDALSNGAVTVNGGILDIKTFSDTVGAVTLTSGSIDGTTGVLTGTSYALNGTVNTSVSAILGGAVALTKSNAGTATLSGANTYTGLTDVQVGVLRASNNNAFGTTAGGVTITSGAAVELSGTNLAIGAEALSLSGTGISNGGALRNVSGNNSWAGAITLVNVAGVHRINSDSGLLTIGAGGIGETGTNDNKNLTFGGAGDVTVTGNITATADDMLLSKDGAGTLTLSGSGNTYNGLTTISGGTLAYGATNIIVGAVTVNGGILDIKTFSDTVGAVTLTSGSINGTTGVLTGASYTLNGTVNTSVSAILAGAAVTLGKSGAGTATLTGENTYAGATSVTVGKLVVDGSLGGTAVTVSGGASLGGNGSIGTSTAGAVTLTAGASNAARGAIDLTDGTIGTLNFAAKTAANTTVLTIGGTAGNTSILKFDVGATADQIALGTNARLNIGAGGGLVRLTGLGGLTGTTQTLISSSTAKTGAGTLANLVLDTNTGNFSGYTLALAVSSNNLNLTETANAAAAAAYWKGTNDGVWNSFTGGNTNTSNFASNIGGTNATGKVGATTDVNFNATVTANFANTTLGEDFTIKTLTFGSAATSAVGIGGSNTLTITPGASTTGVTVASGSGNHTISSKVALGANQTWTVTAAGQTLTASNEISGGFALTKAGAGTLSLSAANTYTGDTTIKAGTLALTGAGNLASTNIIVGDAGSSGTVLDALLKTGGGLVVASGQTLSGIGTIKGTTTIQGTIAPGNSAGILNNLGNIDLQGASNFNLELNGTSVGTQYDQLNVTGSVTLAGLLNLTIGYTPIDGDMFFVLANDLSDAITGTFSNAPVNGQTYAWGGQEFQISYYGDSDGNTFTGGNDVVLMAVPETSAAVLGGLGVLLLLRRRRTA